MSVGLPTLNKQIYYYYYYYYTSKTRRSRHAWPWPRHAQSDWVRVLKNRNWNWNSCAGRSQNLKICPSAWLFTSTRYARVVCSLELLRGELSRGYTGLNSDPRNDSFSDKIHDAKHVDRSTHYSRCRSTQVKSASTDLWPQEMFTFSEMLALFSSRKAVSVPTSVIGGLGAPWRPAIL